MSIISIVIPVYNAEKYLVRCIESILGQTFHDYELILVDDGSQDQSLAICEKYSTQDDRIHVIHQQNKGPSIARNSGIEWALNRSEYIAFIDSDDWIHPQYLEKMYSAIQSEECGVAVCRFVKSSEETVEWESTETRITQILPSYLYCNDIMNFIVCWGKLFHTRDFEHIRFPNDQMLDDEGIIWKIMFLYNHVAYIDMPMYAYFQRSDSLIHSPWSMKRLSWIDALKAQQEWIDQHGNEQMKQTAKKRLAVECAKCVRGLISIDAEQKTIHLYMKMLKAYIRDARPVLPFAKNYMIYRTAWPNTSRILIRIINAKQKLKTLLRIV